MDVHAVFESLMRKNSLSTRKILSIHVLCEAYYFDIKNVDRFLSGRTTARLMPSISLD